MRICSQKFEIRKSKIRNAVRLRHVRAGAGESNVNPKSKIQNPKVAPQGRSFLIETRSPGDVFTPEDTTDQHRLIAQTAQEFIDQEIVPHIQEIEDKKPGVLKELLRKAAEVGLSSTDLPQ